MLSNDLTNSHSQVSNPESIGHLVEANLIVLETVMIGLILINFRGERFVLKKRFVS